jgi:MFS family permease
MVKSRPFGQRYAFVVTAVIFACLLLSASSRSAPGVYLIPWAQQFGWTRATISGAIALGILVYGLIGPFAAALMLRFGVRRVLFTALTLMAASTAISVFMTAPWELYLTWGIMSGLGSGCVALTLGATIVNRWFAARRGLIMGIFAASTATGTLIFLPLNAFVTSHEGWRTAVCLFSAGLALLIPLVFFLLPERPADAGLLPYGGTTAPIIAPLVNPFVNAFTVLFRAARTTNFWLLFSTFFVCGLTTNGLVGTHLIALCADHNIGQVQAASLLAVMGAFDLVGTTASGWLTDRYDSRKLLFAYYGLRGLSLIYLPYCNFSIESLSIFSIFYGLDWIATVPPTVKLANASFGDRDAPIVFGWIAAGHQMGAATAALLAGIIRQLEGAYLPAFVLAGALAVAAAFLSLTISPRRAALTQ